MLVPPLLRGQGGLAGLEPAALLPEPGVHLVIIDGWLPGLGARGRPDPAGVPLPPEECVGRDRRQQHGPGDGRERQHQNHPLQRLRHQQVETGQRHQGIAQGRHARADQLAAEQRHQQQGQRERPR